MEKSTKLIIAAVGLGGLGFFLFKKGLFSNSAPSVAPKAPVAPTKTTLKNAPTCPEGYKLQMVDINCNGQDCEVHCVPIPSVPERKINPVPTVKDEPFKGIPENPILFYPNTNTPIEVVLNPYVGVPQNKIIPVSDNSFRGDVGVLINDPSDNIGFGRGTINKELNQMLYL